MSDENTKDLTGDSFSDREILLALRQGLLDLTAEMRTLSERVARLETRTNPLPPNYDERFAALEARVDEIARQGERTERAVTQNSRALRDIREDLERERHNRQALEDRVERLESQAA